jgi:hypothetical protein
MEGFGHDVPWRSEELQLEPTLEGLPSPIFRPTRAFRRPAPKSRIEEEEVILLDPTPHGLLVFQHGNHEGEGLFYGSPEIRRRLSCLPELLGPDQKGLPGV